jgi:prolipoprotein diacylglyceryltransferase
LLYGIFRFVENFWREDARYLGISVGQYLCILMIIVAGVFIYRMIGKKK